jgi:predicted Fe-S protein YdhL (DUF1289 family)
MFVAALLATVTTTLLIWSGAAEPAVSSQETNVVSLPATGLSAARSPVDFFRTLLAADTDEVTRLLAGRSPDNQQRLIAKLHEYKSLSPDERELRLRATELQWYLVPLLSLRGTNQQACLAQVPADLRKLVEERLNQWNLLPPPLQKEFLENDQILGLYLQLEFSTPAQKEALFKSLPPARRKEVETGSVRWRAMSDKERRKTLERANHFFDLTPEEKAEVLGTLPEAERRQMEETLQAFERLKPEQRTRCIHAFGKLAAMSAEQRQQFLKNAARWQAMTPTEREAWRDLVKQIPIWPPEPPEPPPLPPPQLLTPPGFVAPAVTNRY